MTKAEVHLIDHTVLRGLVYCGSADRFDSRLSDVLNSEHSFLPLIAAERGSDSLAMPYVCVNKAAISYVVELETQLVPEGGWGADG
jgi:hypothetical protein